VLSFRERPLNRSDGLVPCKLLAWLRGSEREQERKGGLQADDFRPQVGAKIRHRRPVLLLDESDVTSDRLAQTGSDLEWQGARQQYDLAQCGRFLFDMLFAFSSNGNKVLVTALSKFGVKLTISVIIFDPTIEHHSKNRLVVFRYNDLTIVRI
jgi:hypothetical protein